MLTKDDFDKLEKVFATKYDLQRLEERIEGLATRDDFRSLMTAIDGVFTEVKAMREEQAMHVGVHQRVDEEIDSLKSRVGKLETSPVIPH